MLQKLVLDKPKLYLQILAKIVAGNLSSFPKLSFYDFSIICVQKYIVLSTLLPPISIIMLIHKPGMLQKLVLDEPKLYMQILAKICGR